MSYVYVLFLFRKFKNEFAYLKKFFLDEKSYSLSSESFTLGVIPVVFPYQFTVGHHPDIWIEGALYLQVC
jgi:hypothetical protein